MYYFSLLIFLLLFFCSSLTYFLSMFVQTIFGFDYRYIVRLSLVSCDLIDMIKFCFVWNLVPSNNIYFFPWCTTISLVKRFFFILRIIHTWIVLVLFYGIRFWPSWFFSLICLGDYINLWSVWEQSKLSSSLTL